MPQPAATTISSPARLRGGDSQSIVFRPGLPGTIYIQSTPPPPLAHTQTGLLAAVKLFRPGSTQPLKNIEYPIDGPFLSLAYIADEADLATPGDWVAVVYNASLDPFTFATDVTFPID